VPQLILAAGSSKLRLLLDYPPQKKGAWMRTMSIDYQTDAERIAIEQAVAYVKHMNQLALSAAHGSVLKICEQAALTEGKKLLRTTLQGAVQSRIDESEKKGGRLVPVRSVPPHSGTRVGTQEMC
jgi:hypothetical protein